MALTLSPIVTVTFNLVDETGSRSSVEAFAARTTPHADVLTESEQLAGLITDATGATVTSYGITYGASDPTPPAADSGSRVERKALFLFNTTVPRKYTRISLPAPLPSFINPDGRIDDDAPAVAALAQEMIGGIWTDSNGNSITSLKEAYERHNSTTRRQKPSNRRPD